MLIAAGREGRRPSVVEVCERLQISEQELREDISVLNVVNFGGGAYVIYAEVQGDEIEIDTEPYSDTFDRPARLLPIEANALMAAIEFLGTHLSDHLQTAHDKIEAALGEIGRDGLLVGDTGADDSDIARDVSRAIEARKLIELEYWQPNEDTFSTRTVEPYALMNGREGWYIASFDPSRDDTRSFRLDRVKRVAVLDESYEPRASVDEIAVVEGWPRTGEVEGSRIAHVWISPEQARWMREERTVLAELPDGAVIIEWAYKGEDYLVKEVLKEAGDAAVLEPADAREAVLRRRRATARPAPGEPPRPDQDEPRGGGRLPRGAEDADLRHQRARRLPAPDAALVRAAGRAHLGLDVREVAEGREPRARPAGDAAGRDRGRVRGAARRDAALRRDDPPRRRGS